MSVKSKELGVSFDNAAINKFHISVAYHIVECRYGSKGAGSDWSAGDCKWLQVKIFFTEDYCYSANPNLLDFSL